jgi:hypothetical protein
MQLTESASSLKVQIGSETGGRLFENNKECKMYMVCILLLSTKILLANLNWTELT